MKPLNSIRTKTSRIVAPIASAALVVGALVFLPGCATEPESHVVSAPPPNVVMPVTTAPAQIVVTQAPSPAGTIVLTQAPPSAPQVVVAQPARPSREYAWVDGHWTYRNGRYEWVNGQWERPPFSGAVWIPPHSEQQSSGSYLFYEGHWSAN